MSSMLQHCIALRCYPRTNCSIVHCHIIEDSLRQPDPSTCKVAASAECPTVKSVEAFMPTVSII